MPGTVIKIVPGDFETAFSELETLQTSLQEYKATMESSYSAMSANWSGAAASAFDARIPKLFKDYDALLTKMKTVAEDIKKVGDDMQTLDQQLADSM